MSPIPNIQSSPAYDAQAIPDSSDWAAITQGFNVTGIVSGCIVSAFGTPAMGVAISAGSVAVGGNIVTVNAASVTIATASTTDRRDIVIATAAGTVSVVMGTPCGTANWTRETYPGLPPVKPGIPTNCVFLGEVYVANTTTSVSSGNVEVSGTQLLVTNQYVNSFNGRNGIVTLGQSDIEGTFAAAGQIPVGTGGGTGTYLSVGSVGTVLTSQGSSAVPVWIPGSGGAASAGVSSYNGRTGPVFSQATDVERLFTAPGQVFVGTGSTTGELLTAGSVGTVLTSNGAASIPSWQPPPSASSASVTATAIESTFTTAGQLYVGTGSGSGSQLTAGSVGSILTGNGSASVPSWQSAAVAIQSSFTKAGQIYTGTGTGTGTALTSGSVGYVLTSNGAASVPSWQPAPGAGYILAQKQYGPTSGSVYTLGASFVALDTTNLTVGPFVVPASGSIILEINCTVEAVLSSAGSLIFISLGYLNHAGGGIIGPAQGVFTVQNFASSSVFVPSVTYKTLITGRTPGETLQLDLAAQETSSGSTTGELVAWGAGGNEYAPVVMTVYNPQG